MSRFLRFVIERHLEGKDDELKESVIALEIFGRRADHDPKRDPIVRTEASRLRARLGEYYLNEGKGDELLIELPKGGYIPVIRRTDVVSEGTAPSRLSGASGGAGVNGFETAPEVLVSESKQVRSWSRRRLWLVVLLAGLAVFIAATASWWFQHKSAPIAVAVLPLDNLSRDPVDDYFADGLTDELIRNLSLIEGLAPRSRTSSFEFKGKPRNLHEVGKLLEVDYVLEGSVLRAGQQLRINVQGAVGGATRPALKLMTSTFAHALKRFQIEWAFITGRSRRTPHLRPLMRVLPTLMHTDRGCRNLTGRTS
jgi:TolB-like protein